MDKRHCEARNQLKTEMSSEVTAAIATLTTVVAKIEIGQANFMQQFSSDKGQQQSVQDDQVELFLNNLSATGMEVDVLQNQEPKQTGPPPQTTIGSLPSTIGKVALTTLQGLNKRGGRGGGRDLRQQTLMHHITPTSNIATQSTHAPSNATQHIDHGGMGNQHT